MDHRLFQKNKKGMGEALQGKEGGINIKEEAVGKRGEAQSYSLRRECWPSSCNRGEASVNKLLWPDRKEKEKGKPPEGVRICKPLEAQRKGVLGRTSRLEKKGETASTDRKKKRSFYALQTSIRGG